MIAISGRRCAASYATPGPAGLLLRTLAASPIWHSTLYWLTWKRMATPRGRSFCLLRASERPTSATAASSSPVPMTTPCAHDHRNQSKPFSQGGTPLALQVQQLPTPRFSDGERGGRGDLIQAVRGNPNSHYRTYPTPRRSDANGAGRHGGGGMDLRTAVRALPTPTVTGNHNRAGLSAKSGDGLATAIIRGLDGTDAPPSKASGSLNPQFVEWMMGFPPDWTAIADD
jgi:hypothetical protein